MRGVLVCGLLIASFGAASAQFYGKYQDFPQVGQGRVPAQGGTNAEIRVEQKLNTVLSTDIVFTDSDGKRRTTGDLFDDKPSLLLMVFYQCSGVCTIELNSLLRTVKGMKKDNVGEDFNVTIVSIDPTETPELAAQKKQTYLELYDREVGADGWRFLTGDEANIDRLAKEVGFHFYRDPENGNITHPAALMVVSPERRMTRYFLTQEFDAKPVLLALQDAEEDRVGIRDDFVSFISCVNVDPLTGRRSLDVMKTLRLGGIATLLLFGTSVLVMNRKGKLKQMQQDGDV